MPTYEYACDACAHEFEAFQSITAAPLRRCPTCGKAKLRRLISAGGGVIFKGSGFYQTDYRSESYKKAAEAETKAAAGESGEKKSDAKPDSASATKEAAKPSTGESTPEKSPQKAQGTPAEKSDRSAPARASGEAARRSSAKARTGRRKK